MKKTEGATHARSENKKKEPIIIAFSPEELEKLRERFIECEYDDDPEEFEYLGKVYPLDAKYLNLIKQMHGIDFIIENEFNVYNAVNKYGKEWLER